MHKLSNNNTENPAPPPHSEVAEKGILSLLFQKPDQFIERIEADEITAAHFYTERPRDLFNCIRARHNAGKVISLPAVIEGMTEGLPAEEAGNVRGDIAEIFSFEALENTWPRHLEELRGKAASRELIRMGNALVSGGMTGELAQAALEKAGHRLTELSAGEIYRKGPKPFSWSIVSGAEAWTADPVEIAALSDGTIIEGLLREREVGTIVGGAKTLKTWFALKFAVAAASESEFLGHTVNNCRVLYLDYELKPGSFKRRLSMVAETPPADLDFQTLRGCSRLPTVDEIAELIREKGYKLVVIDSLYRTGWLGEENSNDSTGRELTALQILAETTGATVIIVDHTAKGGGNERSAVDAARGASAKGGFFDALFVLRPQEKAEAGEHRAILDMVLRDWPAPAELPVINYQFTATSCRMTLAGLADPSDLNGTRQRIFEAVASAGEKGASVAEVAAVVKMSDGATRNHLNALIADGGKIVGFVDKARHAQTVWHRLPDLIDNHAEPRTTPQNP